MLRVMYYDRPAKSRAMFYALDIVQTLKTRTVFRDAFTRKRTSIPTRDLESVEILTEPAPKHIRDFVTDELTEENWYNTPEYMSVWDANYSLKYYHEEGREIPEGLTPELFAQEWNRQITYDRIFSGKGA